MVRLVVPLIPGGKPEFKIDADPVSRRLKVEVSGLRRDAIRVLGKQLGAAGGRLLRSELSNNSRTMLLELPFDNLQVQAAIRNRPKRLILDVGTGRYLPPSRSRPAYVSRMSFKLPNAEGLKKAEEAWSRGNLEHASLLLEVLERDPGDTGILACLLSADLSAIRNDLESAGTRAHLCFARAETRASILTPLTVYRLAAYGGNLHLKDLDLLTGHSAERTDWIDEELRFERARIHIARGELEIGLGNLLQLFQRHPTSGYGAEAKSIVLRAVDRYQERMRESGRYATLATTLLALLGFIPALEDSERLQLSSMIATALLSAGLPRLASGVLLWHIRQDRRSKAPGGVFRLLADAFLQAGDEYRASKTLDFLGAVGPGPKGRGAYRFLKGKVAQRAGRIAEAIRHFQAAARDSDERVTAVEAAIRGARLLRDRGKFGSALRLLNVTIEKFKSALPDALASDILLLKGDLAYEADLKDQARVAYRFFLQHYPDDPRVSVIKYRMMRVSTVEATGIQGTDPDDVWLEAARVWANGNQPATRPDPARKSEVIK